MTRFRDSDGEMVERDRYGDLVPSTEPEPLPSFSANRLCSEHAEPFGNRAATCAACWSEIKSGDRPRRYLGRVYEPESPDERTQKSE